MIRPLMLTALLLCAPAFGYDAATPHFRIVSPWAHPTERGDAHADVYLRIENITARDRLIGVRSGIAETVQIRDNGKSVPSLDLRVGKVLELKPSSTHLLMLGLKETLRPDRSYELTLIFEKAGAVETRLSVAER